MSKSYRHIPVQLTRKIKLVMTDVDGTLNDGGEVLVPEIHRLIRRLEEIGVVVGLVSGRTLSRLKNMARDLDITGPIIAENGGVAILQVDGELVDLGYSRQPALEAMEKLMKLFPGAVIGREDNEERLIDVVVRSKGVSVSELRKHVGDTQLLDSGYLMHLMQRGISKGKTLQRLLELLPYESLTTENVIAIGDSMTDISLFEFFPNSILVPSPRLSDEERQQLGATAGFVSDHSISEGFAEVVTRIVNARTSDAISFDK
ncbi:HAD hydrolase family protein [Chloroflexota bacterium]